MPDGLTDLPLQQFQSTVSANFATCRHTKHNAATLCLTWGLINIIALPMSYHPRKLQHNEALNFDSHNDMLMHDIPKLSLSSRRLEETAPLVHQTPRVALTANPSHTGILISNSRRDTHICNFELTNMLCPRGTIGRRWRMH